MTEQQINLIAANWAQLGVMFGASPVRHAVDLERLLLDTARTASANSRLLVMAVTWLARHGEAVGKHRLAALIRRELEPEFRPTMGLLLDLARSADKANHTRFDLAIRSCTDIGESLAARPLSDIEHANPVLSGLAERRASALSRKWGRWYEPFEPKHNALRPVTWVMRHNPGLYERSLAGGNLTASILAECETRRAKSEADLAYRCAASRPAIRAALRSLERTGRIQILRHGRSHQISLRDVGHGRR